jgi:4-hydroxybenzoate polyprenyltransferase
LTELFLKIKEKLFAYAQTVKFEHTVFALPFGLSAVALLAYQKPSAFLLFWIVVALVSARTMGMALNRLIDRPYDRLNPRTSGWSHVSGRVGPKELWGIILISGGVFLYSCYRINTLALLLSPIVIALLIIYPFAKRFTHFPHLFLGGVYFLIPLGVDVALNAEVSVKSLILGAAMATWVSGFDILYSLQDLDFDKKHGLRSVPVLMGVRGALIFARLLHLLTLLCLLIVGFLDTRMGPLYFSGLVLITFFLIYEHYLIKPHDLSKINRAFFTVNGWISVAFFMIVLSDRFF